jgi:hypothetical protein
VLGDRVWDLIAGAAFGDDDESILAPQNPSQPGADQLLVVDQQHGDVRHLSVDTARNVGSHPRAESQRAPTIPARSGPRRSRRRATRLVGACLEDPRPSRAWATSGTLTGRSLTRRSTAAAGEIARSTCALEAGACLAIRTFLMPSMVAPRGRWFWWPRLPSRQPRRRFSTSLVEDTSANWATRRVRSGLSN